MRSRSQSQRKRSQKKQVVHKKTKKKTKAKRKKKKMSSARLQGFSIVFLLLSLVILSRSFYLQTQPAKPLEKLTQRQGHSRIEIQPHRGTIFDRNRTELAVSLPVKSAYINPKVLAGVDIPLNEVAKILGINRGTLQKKIKSDRYFSWLKRHIAQEEYEKLESLIPRGLGSVKEDRRYYPHRTLASHVLGFVGIEGTGLGGIEYSQEKTLNLGKKKIVLPKDGRGRSIDIENKLTQSSQWSGKNIVLTLDRTLQYIAERELERVALETKAKAGTIIMMDPYNGDILSLANYPTFDPNHYSQENAAARKNRAITDVVEPGSVFKVFLIAGAMQEGLIQPDQVFDCENGKMKVHNTVINDVKPHDKLTVSEILKYSSNIGAYKIAELYSSKDFYKMIKELGFGEKLEVGLSGESKGIVPHYKTWQGVTQGNIGFGQGIAVTPLQLVNAMATVANGGYAVTPRLIMSVEDPEKSAPQSILSEPKLGKRIFSKHVVKTVTDMMVRVTGEEGGTGGLAAIPGFSVAGKTGTSQKPDLQKGGYQKGAYVSSFVGFVPAENPRFVMLVLLDEPEGQGYGGVVAAPAFRRIAEKSLEHMGLAPQTGEFLMSSVAEVSGEGKDSEIGSSDEPELSLQVQPSWLMPDLRGMTLRQALRQMEDHPMEMKIKGFGIVTDQRPLPGENPNGKSSGVLIAKPNRSQKMDSLQTLRAAGDRI